MRVFRKIKNTGLYQELCRKKYIRISSSAEIIVYIKIQKTINLIHVIIYIGLPKLLIADGSRRIKELQSHVQKQIDSVNKKLNITITKIAKPYGHPNILAEYIAEQLKDKVSFRKAIKKAIALTKEATTKGIQVQIAWCIDRKEIARVEWFKEGKVPLQTIQAKISYCSYTVRTIYGALSIKI